MYLTIILVAFMSVPGFGVLCLCFRQLPLFQVSERLLWNELIDGGQHLLVINVCPLLLALEQPLADGAILCRDKLHSLG